MEEGGAAGNSDDQGLLIDQRSDKFCHLISHLDLPWFSCGTCTHSRISLCTSLHSCDTQALPVSCDNIITKPK